MDIFGSMQTFGHEQLLLSHDPSCGYCGIIAIHDTTLGPALGGTRFWQYASTEEAVTDALRLARGMTYKAAVAGINLGGGKCVIIGDNTPGGPRGAVPGARPLRRDLERPVHHRRGHRHQPGGHGVHQAGDRPRRRPARALGRSFAGHRLRRVRRHQGRGQGAVGKRLRSRGRRWRSRAPGTSPTTCAAICTTRASG